MAFKKGSSGNPGGRPPGAKNRVNEEFQDASAEFLNCEFAMVKQEFTLQEFIDSETIDGFSNFLSTLYHYDQPPPPINMPLNCEIQGYMGKPDNS